jgi:hypothetical protein
MTAVRRIFTLGVCLILLFVVSLVRVSIVLGIPTVTFKAKALPIPGFPGTGNILGAGTEVETQVTIGGSEYAGFPSPMTGLNVYAPAGAKVTAQGFATCSPSVLKANGADACPKNSRAGPPGVGLGVVAFGGEEVPETVSIESFFAPGSGPTFFVEGRTPAFFQVLEKSHWVMASAPFGPELIIEVPLIETVPGGNDASVTGFKVKVGAAYKKGKKTVSYLTTPKTCPEPMGGFPIKLELKFLSGATVTATDVVPCPKHKRPF